MVVRRQLVDTEQVGLGADRLAERPVGQARSPAGAGERPAQGLGQHQPPVGRPVGGGEAPRPTGVPLASCSGAQVFETLAHSSANRSWQSVLAREVAPELAPPIEPSSISTQP